MFLWVSPWIGVIVQRYIDRRLYKYLSNTLGKALLVQRCINSPMSNKYVNFAERLKCQVQENRRFGSFPIH